MPGDEGRGRVGHVGIEEDDDVADGRLEGGGHGLALAARAVGGPRTTRAPASRGLFGRVVGRAVVEHDDLVDQPVFLRPGPGRADHRPHDRAHGGGLVAGRDADRDRAAPPWPRAPGQGEVPVVVGVAARPRPYRPRR